MIVTEGGRFGGYGLFLSKGEFGIGRGKVVFLYNLLDLKRTAWEGPELAPGKHTIVFDFKPDGPGLGKGGTGVLSVDGKEVARNSWTTPRRSPSRRTRPSTSAWTPARQWRSSSIAMRRRSSSPARSTSSRSSSAGNEDHLLATSVIARHVVLWGVRCALSRLCWALAGHGWAAPLAGRHRAWDSCRVAPCCLAAMRGRRKRLEPTCPEAARRQR